MSMSIKAAHAQRVHRGNYAGRNYGALHVGDPGLFSSIGNFVKGAVKTVAGVALGAVRSSPIGAAIGTVAGIAGAGKAVQQQLLPALPGIGQVTPPGLPVPGVKGVVQRLLPGGETGYGAPGPAPSGYRLNKSGYFLRSGEFVPPGTRYVRTRRRNPANPRALDRAMSRLSSAKRLEKKLGRFTIKGGRRCR